MSSNEKDTDVAVSETQGKEVIGAWCVLKFMDDGKIETQYFSFKGLSENDSEEHEYDGAGIPDNDIYYFADGGEEELKMLMKAPSDGCMNEFLIESYELRYQEIEHKKGMKL